MPVVNPGIRRFLGSAIQRLFNSASVSLPLTHTAVPTRGSITPTFTRATTETGQRWDEAGYLDFTALAGEIVFKGARRVRNLLTATESVAAWTVQAGASITDLGGGEFEIDVSGAALNAGVYIVTSGAPTIGRVWVGSIYIKAPSVTGDGAIKFYNPAQPEPIGGTSVTLTSDYQRASTGAVTAATGTGAGFWFKKETGKATLIRVKYPQLEDVTGQTTQTASEYVSVGVESAPAYHGSMVDGVKCYSTDRSGNPITTTTTYDAVSLNGVAGTYVSTPDSVANSPSGTRMALVAKLRPTAWVPAAQQVVIGKYKINDWSYAFSINTSSNGYGGFQCSSDGTTQSSVTFGTATPFANGETGYLAVTRNGVTVKFFSSSDGTSWTQFGGDKTIGFSGAIWDSDQLLVMGGWELNASILSGGMLEGQVYNGIPPMLGGTDSATPAVDFDASRYAGGTTLTGSTGETWTLQGNAVIHPTNYPLVGYVPWEARTNLCLQSNAFTTTWADAFTPCTAAQNVVGPDGATSAWTLTDDNAGFIEEKFQGITLVTATVYTASVFIKKTTGALTSYPVMSINRGDAVSGDFILNTTTGTAVNGGASINDTIRVGSYNDSFWRLEATFTSSGTAGQIYLAPAGSANGTTVVASATGSAVFYGAQVELGSFATPYIPTTTVAVARNADVDQYPTTAGPIAAAGSIALDFTPYHAPSGTIALWGTYVDASNYTAILHDATNLIFRKRIAGSNYDATIANAFVSGTTCKIAATWGAAGTAIYLDGVAGTPHANTTAAQIAATMQVGADGNSLQQPGAGTTNLRIWQRQLSSPEGVAVTA